jgi:hypothetical protein
VDCTHRSGGWVEASLRQRRGDLYVARAWVYFEFECTGSEPWNATAVSSESIGFGTGDARLRVFLGASSGFDHVNEEIPLLVTLT